MSGIQCWKHCYPAENLEDAQRQISQIEYDTACSNGNSPSSEVIGELRVINLTPHDVNIVDDSGYITETYPSEGVARVMTTFQQIGVLDYTPIKKVTYGATEGLPKPVPGTTYIVSMVVAQANPERTDLVCPNTAPGEVLRDDKGNIYGVRSFSRI